MARGNGRRGGLLKTLAAAGAGLGVGAIVAKRGGFRLPKIPNLSKVFQPRRQAALQKQTASPFPSFFRESAEKRSRRARFEALKAESAKVSLPAGGNTLLGSFVDLFGG